MSLIADILLVAASLGLAIYCVVLSRRLSRFTDLEKGVGGAVAVLSAQVDDLTRALHTARETAQGSVAALSETTTRAEEVARRLELHVAAMHDLPIPQQPESTACEAPHPADEPAPTPQATPARAAAADSGPKLAFAHSGPIGRHRAGQAENIRPVAREEHTTPTPFASHRHIQPGALG